MIMHKLLVLDRILFDCVLYMPNPVIYIKNEIWHVI